MQVCLFLKSNEGLNVANEPPPPPTTEKGSYTANAAAFAAVAAAEKKAIDSLFDSFLARQKAQAAEQSAPESAPAASIAEEEEANRNKVNVTAMMSEIAATLREYEAKREKLATAVSKMMDKARALQVLFAEEAARKEKQFEIGERIVAARTASTRAGARSLAPSSLRPEPTQAPATASVSPIADPAQLAS